MEKLINSFLDTKYHEPLWIKIISPKDAELYVKCGENTVAYGMVRKGDLYNYIEWMVPAVVLNEINPYFGIGWDLQDVILKWMKDKFAKEGYNVTDPKITKQFRNKI